MRKIICTRKNVTRHQLANPYSAENLKERLKQSKVINLKDNHELEDLGNGYFIIKPKDETKFI